MLSRLEISELGDRLRALARRRARPRDAVVAVNGVCNARCRMCSIWETEHAPILDPAALEGLPRTLRDLNLTGGEPFLRADLPELARSARRLLPRARIVVSTNGFLSERILQAAAAWQRESLRIGIAVSVDGIGRMHDEMRGVPGAYRRVVSTLRGLRALRYQPRAVAFTVTRINVSHLGAVYGLSRRLGARFSCTLAHDSPHYFQIAGQEDHRAEAPALAAQLDEVARSELAAWSPRRWARAYYLSLLADTAASGERPLPCRAGRDFFYADWNGSVYPCNILPIRLGRIDARGGVRALLSRPETLRAIEPVATCRRCWMVCTARTALRRHWRLAAGWIVRAQARRLAGAPVVRAAAAESAAKAAGGAGAAA
jgi:radical SAM protein with 4Fe4S-binding SPASM domain